VERLSVWVGAGLVTVGVSAAMIAGAGVALADSGSASESGASSSSESSESANHDATKPDLKKNADKPAKPKKQKQKQKPATAESGETQTGNGKATDSDADVSAPDPSTPEPAPEIAKADDTAKANRTDKAARTAHRADVSAVSRVSAGEATTRTDGKADSPKAAAVETVSKPEVGVDGTSEPSGNTTTVAADVQPSLHAAVESTTKLESGSAAEVTATATAPRPSIVGLLTSVVFSLLSGLERLVTGPPVVPGGSTVTVRNSSLQITDGLTVPANWYYPEGEDPPDRLILLQHGFLAIGPMYSYTAARLAESTDSIVVTPTLTSNPFADGGLWLGGDGMHTAVANLFVGSRTALTASALAAGYAEQYNLDPEDAVLPEKFALAGHSLGGALVSGVAGHLVDNGAADDLVGVILLDGVPTGDQLPNALTKLAAYQTKTGRYIPVREIGAPLNLWNSPSNVNQSLSQARPNHFNGVILTGGVHMDSMQGHNPLIQFFAYVAAGFPQKQNPPAVQELMVDWFDDWFDGHPFVDDNLAPGSTITIDTPKGPATGTVIGTPVAVSSSSKESDLSVAV
jgi:hypothetical protein